jgi:maltooligosyltrehalose trehalohydrolase
MGARPPEFRAWAPNATSVVLRLRDSEIAMEHAGDGVYEVVAPARAGDDYWFVLDGRRFPDPASRWQPEGLRGPSRVYIPQPVRPPFAQPTPRELVIYELHVGTFSEAGTFDGAIPHLGELASLGITAIEIMPVAEFPGTRGWGYDGVYLSAAQSSYGGPAALERLVAASHQVGLAVILDVVYNHIGASGVQALEAFGPYFTDKHETPWGRAINFDDAGCEGVREWVLQSAEGWLREFGIDGLRLDAIHAIIDSSDEHIVEAIARRVHSLSPRAFVIGEVGLDDPRQSGASACDAIWSDYFHHALHVLLTGERDGYYAQFGRVADLADALRLTPPERFVAYAQNHDQVGNRAFGDRLPRDVRSLAAFCTLLAPDTPLLFMGEEYGEEAPFQFFSDHIDPKIADATREGRRDEFAAFAQFARDEIPDPQATETFERSKLTRRRDPALVQLYRDLLAARGRLPDGDPDTIAFDEESKCLRVTRGRFEIVCNFGPGPVRLRCEGERVEIATDRRLRVVDDHIELPSLSGALIG